ncbi:hypothetical protein, partial [Phocaeicola sp.]|uniref:hypothetical protein n=1 Tax=Phocaeicola sp. TaxID=2773926 RepID=UPI003868B925
KDPDLPSIIVHSYFSLMYSGCLHMPLKQSIHKNPQSHNKKTQNNNQKIKKTHKKKIKPILKSPHLSVIFPPHTMIIE